MATITPKPLVEGTLLGNAAATLYTVPAATTAVQRSITIVNNDTVDRVFTVQIVPALGVPGLEHMIFNALLIQAGKTLEDDILRVLLTGATIRAFADVANKVAIRIDGSEIS